MGWFVCLTVADTGCGMEPKVLQRIFEPFSRPRKSARELGWTGHRLLALSNNIMAGSKSKAKWASAHFQSVLPMAGKAGDAPADPSVKSENVRGGKETILLVEDEIGLLELVREILQQYQYRVLIASSGVEALRVWDECNGRLICS